MHGLTTTLLIVYWCIPQRPPLSVLRKTECCWSRCTHLLPPSFCLHSGFLFHFHYSWTFCSSFLTPLFLINIIPAAASKLQKKRNNWKSSKPNSLNTNFSHFICKKGIFTHSDLPSVTVKCFMEEAVSHTNSANCSLQNDTASQTVSWCLCFVTK